MTRKPSARNDKEAAALGMTRKPLPVGRNDKEELNGRAYHNESRLSDRRLPNGWRGRFSLLRPQCQATGIPPSQMSSYELFASVTHSVVSSHVDGTIFCTLCIDIDRHLFDFDKHSEKKTEKEREGRNTSPSVRT